MLRNGTVPGVNQTFSEVVYIGYSFGSAQIYSLANLYPGLTDGIILTDFSMKSLFVFLSLLLELTSNKQTETNLCVLVISLVSRWRLSFRCMRSLLSITLR